MTKLLVSPIFENEDVVFTIGLKGGTDKAAEFIQSLQLRDQAKFRKYFEFLRYGHHIKSPENMRHIKEVRDPTGGNAQVHELKVHSGGGLRLYLVAHEGRWYATHGRKKPKDREVPKEAQKALNLFYADEIERSG